MPKPVSAQPQADPRAPGLAGYADQNPANFGESQIPTPPLPPHTIDGGAERKHVEPNTLPDANSEKVTGEASGPATVPFDETGGKLGPS